MMFYRRLWHNKATRIICSLFCKCNGYLRYLHSHAHALREKHVHTHTTSTHVHICAYPYVCRHACTRASIPTCVHAHICAHKHIHCTHLHIRSRTHTCVHTNTLHMNRTNNTAHTRTRTHIAHLLASLTVFFQQPNRWTNFKISSWRKWSSSLTQLTSNEMYSFINKTLPTH